MSGQEVVFWCLVAFIGYTYLAYPAILALLAWRRPAPTRSGPPPESVSVVLAAFNEERTIAGRLKELTSLVATSARAGEVILVSDGSTDQTTAIASGFAGAGVRVLELPRGGKASALTAGAAAARYDVLVFADARQRWAPDALSRLLQSLADPTVGAVSGDLVVEVSPGVMSGVGMYWRYEKLLRRLESRAGSTFGVSGSISAVRRRLFRPIPPGILLDDVYWPLQVAMQRYRVIHDARACAFDRLPERVGSEFRRKVRTLSGNYQLMARLTAALLPWRNPVWFQFLSHKVFRLFVPWALLGILILSALQPGTVYTAALAAQVTFYALAIVGLGRGRAARTRLASAAASFVILNAAAWLAWWTWASGRASSSWTKVAYTGGVRWTT